MAVKVDYLGMSVTAVQTSSNDGVKTHELPNLKEWGPEIPLKDAIVCFRVNEDKPGEAIKACHDFAGGSFIPPTSGNGDDFDLAAAFGRKVMEALRNDGRFDQGELISLGGDLAKLSHIDNKIADLAKSMVDSFLKKTNLSAVFGGK